jgi:serine/threonine-protein kinase
VTDQERKTDLGNISTPSPRKDATYGPGNRTVGQGQDTQLNPEARTGDLGRRIAASLDNIAAPAATGDPMLGRVFLGKYRILSKLGEGGMGAVYRAHQEEIRRDVAIKVLTASAAGSEVMLKRFHVEAMAVSKLNHPHTIRIYDFGRTEDETLFIVMEYLDGVPLNKFLGKRQGVPVKLALKITREIAESLREAHDKGIVHRDLKPENVFLVRVDDDPLYSKVLDFGVAKLKEAGHMEGTLTQAGMIFGTPRYMSPEQAMAKAVDARTDLYALGCILYEMLAGKPPFVAETPISLLFKHVHETALPIGELRPDLVIPQEVEALVARLLAKDPDDRFPGMKELLDSIRWVEEHLPQDYSEQVVRSADGKTGVLERLGDAGTTPDTFLQESLIRTRQASPSMLPGAAVAPKRKPWAVIAVVVAALLAGGAFAGYRAMTAQPPVAPLPAGVLPILPPSLALVRDVPVPDHATVEVVVNSTPPAAAVLLGERLLGRTPLLFRTLGRKGGTVPVKLRLQEYKDYATTVGLDSDQVIDVELESVKVEGPGTGGKVTVRAVAKGSLQAPPPPVDPVVKPPVEVKPVKVRETKVNPYGKPANGAKPANTKANPYQ